jgi:folylpolyglutamate synthase
VCAITHQILVGRSKKVGLYTSPSIFSIEDRIKINGQAVPQDQFAKTTLLLYNKLGDSPRKNQLLFLVALAIFKEENVDVAIIETHFGGRYDSTNVIRNPVATGITTIGLDHVQGLGGSLEMIAWNKAGIFKTGSPAFSSPQTDSVEKILMKEAFIKNVELTITKPTSQSSIKDEVHAVNSSLAVKLAEACLRRFDDLRPVSANEIIEAIKLLPKQMPGRFHVIEAGPSKWFLDIAHNELSISVSARWFVEEVKQ